MDAKRADIEKIWFQEPRHVEEIVGEAADAVRRDEWRILIRDRMKTVSVALVLCLNLGVDPPDAKKPTPCARKEAWVDPNVFTPQSAQKSAQKIAFNLQKNYEKLQPRARYKSAIDPTVDCVRKLCLSMRRNAKEERVLFHFNGHGVPKPTDAGEIWVFNKNITQYIPLSLYDLQTWMGYPSVYLWDCSSSGTIVNMFLRFADEHSHRWHEEYQRHQAQQLIPELDEENADDQQDCSTSVTGSLEPENTRTTKNAAKKSQPGMTCAVPPFKDSIQMAACSVDETLPFNPDLPADLFTACLSTPVQTSLLCHMLKTGTRSRFSPNIIDELPGQLTDRRTLLGELNWIFTAITDTIAWSCLPTKTFQKLFRQDLLVASLFRSFLLAERVMWENDCHVVSVPQLPAVATNPLWEFWDYTLDICLSNIHNLYAQKTSLLHLGGRNDYFLQTTLKHNLLIELHLLPNPENEYAFSWFFVDQLQGFDIWLKFAVDKKEPPQQLPVVLQVLLSQVHRVRALELLARFVDLGSWAVFSALSVGVFPYALKLLQSGTREVRPALAFIWAKILSVDTTCQDELIKDNGHFYFLQILSDMGVSARMKIVPAPAQAKLVQSEYVNLCIELLSQRSVKNCRLLVLWLLIGLGRLWADYDTARWHAIRNVIYERVFDFLVDDVPEVRAAAVFALGCFVHNTSRHDELATEVEIEVCDQLSEKCAYDGSVLVRKELASALQWYIIDFQHRFATLCTDLDRKAAAAVNEMSPTNHDRLSMQSTDITDASPSGIQRSSSSVFNASNTKSNRSGNEQQHSRSSNVHHTSAVRRLSLVSETSARGGRKISLNDDSVLDPFNRRILAQIQVLEPKTFKDPIERLWLTILHLGLDPFENVAKIWRLLIKYVWNQSTKLREVHSKIILSERERQNSTTLSVGSSGGGGTLPLSHQLKWARGGTNESSRTESGGSDCGVVVDTAAVKFLIGSPSANLGQSSETVSPDSGASVAAVNGIIACAAIVTPPNQPLAASNNISNRPHSAAAATHLTTIINTPDSATSGQHQQGGRAAAGMVGGTPTTQQKLSSSADLSTTAATAAAANTTAPPSTATIDELLAPYYQTYTPKRSIFGMSASAASVAAHNISSTATASFAARQQHMSMAAGSSGAGTPLLSPLFPTSQNPKAIGFGAASSAGVPPDGLVRSQFVDWCSRQFTRPIYQTIHDDDALMGGGDNAHRARNRSASSLPRHSSLVSCDAPFMVAAPTDWAQHTHEGLIQRAGKEADALKLQQKRCETLHFSLNIFAGATAGATAAQRRQQRQPSSQQHVVTSPLAATSSSTKITAIVWSYLRPFLYVADGEQISLYNYQPAYNAGGGPSSLRKPAAHFRALGDNLFQDQITELMVANELTRELLLTGTREGLLQAWDPYFYEHGHELLKPPKLLTAAHLLNDVPRVSVSGASNRTLYRWDQLAGRLLCSGNVRLCRVWDAWAERTIQDHPLRYRKVNETTSCLASDLGANLIACGSSDGTLVVFDPRLPPKDCEVLRFRDQKGPIVGLAILPDDRQRLVTAFYSGDIRVWEPRMYQEPIVEFNAATAAYGRKSAGEDASSAANGSITSGFFSSSQQHLNRIADDRSEYVRCYFTDVQLQSQLLACALTDGTVRLFDISGSRACLSELRFGGASSAADGATGAFHMLAASLAGSLHRPSPKSGGVGNNTSNIHSPLFGSTTFGSGGSSPVKKSPAPAAMRFHQSKVLLGLASPTGGHVSAYGLPSS